MIPSLTWPKALILAYKHDIWQATRGLIFLGTPHQGSLSSRPAIALAWLNSMFGSRMELTTALGAHEEALSDLAETFQQQLDSDKSQRVRIVAVREMKPSYLGPFCLGLVRKNYRTVAYPSNLFRSSIVTQLSGTHIALSGGNATILS